MIAESKNHLIKWKSILKKMLGMNIYNILLGDYSKDILELEMMQKKI